MCLNEWMNEWMELCLCFCIYIYNYIFSLHKMEKKIKNEKPHLPNVIVLFISHAASPSVSTYDRQTLSLSFY